jgi:nucleolar protein 53
LIELSAIEEPHQGTSYNPAAIAHQELLLRAHAVEEKRLEEEARLKGVRGKMEQAKLTVDEDILGVPPGMKVDEPGQEDSDDINSNAIVDVAVPKPLPKPKTKQQRNKAARREAEVRGSFVSLRSSQRTERYGQKRALAAKLTKKRLLASIDSIKSLKRAVDDSYAHQDEIRAQRRLGELEKLKGGLAGMKIGKHKVPAKEIDVQLGEDLSESLRELKACLFFLVVARLDEADWY